MNKESCYNCDKRHYGCHSDCDVYKKYKDNLEKIKKRKKYEKDCRRSKKYAK